ncbi:Rft-1-domain-containing protein [Pseudovirgaria hyperparasitica]|uniref:Man(5)GlcNAc(2)-PP-dolichol translocation protein RFT1 n=1 Tax=Pseudovirgaria hyperparasitica TaxID=470096 RepID=A0A6A6W432_9PEZI|nr:Rft-1-domain-containing protein [Pseudovirgaria hyperparasitica]KAF2755801.1 Rft-1-domain-containing protein [Pseudovirgaria hyperparasitica]
MTDSVLSVSAQGASFLILLQVGSRLLTFAANQVLLRFLSPELLGVSAQLELFSITVLVFARESIRVALQRQTRGTQSVVNLAYLAILIGWPLAFILLRFYPQSADAAVPYFRESLEIYGLATMVELCSEPGFAVAQQQLLYRVRASAETVATVMRCAMTCGIVIYGGRSGIYLGALPFAVGQMSYAVSLLAAYTIQLYPVQSRHGDYLLPKRLPPGESENAILGILPLPLIRLSFSLYLQSAFRYVLTQGDSILISSMASLQDQGGYALASNYGGLIARMLFQPIEESSRTLFARLCFPNAKKEESSTSDLEKASNILSAILKLYNVMSLVVISVGPTLAPLLLQVIAGDRWSATGASEILAHYCYYIPLMAINGVSEAFVAAVASNAELNAQSLTMGVFFAAYGLSAYLFVVTFAYGAKGLVYANCVNMALRIVFNISFVRAYFSGRNIAFTITSTLPSATSITSTIAVTAILMAPSVDVSTKGLLGTLVRVGVMAVVHLAAIAMGERAYLMRCYRMFRPESKETYVVSKS